MKVKDLPPDTPLIGLKLRTPKGVIGYYASEGNCVVMFSKTKGITMPIEGKKDETRMYPQVVERNSDVKEWDVINDENVAVNCMDLTSHKHIMCVNGV